MAGYDPWSASAPRAGQPPHSPSPAPEPGVGYGATGSAGATGRAAGRPAASPAGAPQVVPLQPGVLPGALQPTQGPAPAYPVPPGRPAPGGYRAPGAPAQAGQAIPLQAMPQVVAARGVAAGPAVPGQGARRLLVRPADALAEEEEQDLAANAIKKSPPWLVSAVVHMMLLIILGLIVVATAPRRQISLDASVENDDVWAEQLGEQTEIDSPLGKELTDAVEEPILTPDNLPEVENPFAAPSKLDPTEDGNTATSDLESKYIGLALNGREEGMKKTLLGRYGGTRLTEEAVRLGLEWLARQQGRDGSWSLAGPYSDGVPRDVDNHQAATAMALLAFQGHGDTHLKGDFQKNVAQGWKWLSQEMDADGNFYHEGPFHHRFYTQAQCSIALLEIYGMTKDPKFKEPALRVLKYLLDNQAPEGGWRYTPKTDSDCSVTGWVVMALQSARMAGLEVPEENLRRVEKFLDRIAQHDGARYPYQQGGEVKLSMTAEALLCRQYLGWSRDDPRLVAGMEWITSENNLINFQSGRDVYYWYYATQAAHHMEGDYWKRWNTVMRQVLPEQQVKRGKEAGSWDPDKPSQDQWSPHGGRLYVTCLSIYMLEVYYRHLPIYTKIYSDLFKSGRAPGM